MLEAQLPVLIVDVAPVSEHGGNGRYTAGAIRFAYNDRSAVVELLGNPEDPRIERCDFGTYTAEQFLDDLAQFNSDGGADDGVPNRHQRRMVNDSGALLRWLHEYGVTFEPIYARQSFQRDGRYHFWGGLTLSAVGEGEGLIAAERDAFRARGGQIRHGMRMREILQDGPGHRVVGIRCDRAGRCVDLRASSVILACGGFEANANLREHYLGPAWHHAKVRGSRFNRGDGLEAARRIGADVAGRFDRCHAVPMDLATPDYGNPALPHSERKRYRKISYALGVMLNARGERFVDEGADFRNYTYAQYGARILDQPGHRAWQVFDAKVADLLYDDYRFEHASKVTADSLQELLRQLTDIDHRRAAATLSDFNAAVDLTTPFEPAVKDGRAAKGISPPKSHWANRLDTAPFAAYPVTCGITFTYGGLRCDVDGAVLNTNGEAIPGLYCCGELLGGVFSGGYPGGSGLTSGGVFGRAAGAAAARYAVATPAE